MEQHRFQEIFLHSLQGRLADLLGLKDEAIVSFYMDQSPVQDSFRYRAKYLGLRVAYLLIDDQGDLNQQMLDELISLLDQTPFIGGPNREGDVLIYNHLRKCLHSLNKDIWAIIRKCSLPLCHKKAESIVRETLWPESIKSVQTVHVRRAVMAAWLTLLRQKTGSCFATAPAILIQQNQPSHFFTDLYDLLSMGQIKRTVGGKEFAVPLSLRTDSGELQRIAPFLETSPGIGTALEAGGVALTVPLQKKIKEMGPQTPEKVLCTVLFETVGLTEEELADEEHLSRIQMTHLLAKQGAVFYQKPTIRAQKVADWKKRFTKASITFQTFAECTLLRAWEYTIASLCDVKTEFSRWNLYTGLGLHPDHKGGIGACLYTEVNGELQKCNREVERLAKEYEQKMGAMRALEVMMRSSVSDSRREQLRAELTGQSLSVNALVETRNQWIAKAEALAKFFPLLLEQYDQKLQEYFQELFDPALVGEAADILDDSSAGFRLVYKHGRLDASQWTPIYTGEQYLDCLREFFSNVESEIEVPPEMGKNFIPRVTTALIQFIREPGFLEQSFSRSKEIGRRAPWEYISGGTLQTLLMAYYNRDQPFTELKIVPHSEEELLHFLTNIKQKGPLLIHSPTHAFILYPVPLDSKLEFKMGTWDGQMQEHLVLRVGERLPEEERASFVHLCGQKTRAATNMQFRTNLIEALGPRIKNKAAIVDSILYEQTPLSSQTQAQEAIEEILQLLGRPEKGPNLKRTFLGPLDVYQIVKSMFPSLSSVDWDLKIAETMRHLGFAQPTSSLFADTNWSGWFFGFVQNPATGRLEFWRLNRNGTRGFPMTDWKDYLSSQNILPWVILSESGQYGV